jgi:methionine-rich copper-binding protein CopC
MQMFIRGMIAVLALGGFTTIAQAHAMLDQASPAVGSSVSGSPGVIRLWFTEALEPRFSGAEVTGPSGSRVGGGGSASGNQLSVSVPHLAPGTYHVHWHVISVDTHKTEGSFTFDVRP